MIYETGNRILDRMEHLFGGFTLANVLRWIAGFQLLTWLLSLFSPEFLEWINFDRGAIFSGQVWRIVSWVVFPGARNPIFVLFVVLFLFFVNDGLESEWGSFRLNVYVVTSTAVVSLIGLLPIAAGAGVLFTTIFYSAVFLAFATIYPNQVIHFLGIIPIKSKWLGWANVAILLLIVVQSGAPVLVGGIITAGLIPYFLTFAPGFFEARRQERTVQVRRHRFEGQQDDDEAFHTCATCGATDQTHPERDFRVAADGEEYCDHCREAKP